MQSITGLLKLRDTTIVLLPLSDVLSSCSQSSKTHSLLPFFAFTTHGLFCWAHATYEFGDSFLLQNLCDIFWAHVIVQQTNSTRCFLKVIRQTIAVRERNYNINWAQLQLRQRWLRLLRENKEGLLENGKGDFKKRDERLWKWNLQKGVGRELLKMVWEGGLGQCIICNWTGLHFLKTQHGT